ncbi:MAG: hydrogenase maturation protease [Verrucomicrobiota bacterium]
MKKILIAGIGNIFHGDDGFGCEVVRELNRLNFPGGVTIRDFGIRSYDLAYALTEDYDATILIDATSRGEKPGTVFLIEPDLSRLNELETSTVDPHSMNPVTVLQLAQSLGTISGKLFLVGCEPAVLENDNGEITLSEPVRAAISPAIEMVTSLIAELNPRNESELETILNEATL